jgi:hypothetical protein
LEDVKVEFDIVTFESEVAELTDKGINLCEAMTIWCDTRSVEYDLLSGIIKKNPIWKARVEADARKRNLLKR